MVKTREEAFGVFQRAILRREEEPTGRITQADLVKRAAEQDALFREVVSAGVFLAGDFLKCLDRIGAALEHTEAKIPEPSAPIRKGG